jgi:nucleoside-diphosphate-sugar epimerase
MNILVTGATGFIGSKLVLRLNSLGYNVSSYDRTDNPSETLDNIDLLTQRIRGIDVICHLAGVSDPTSPDLYKINVTGTKNLLNTVNKLKQKTKIIFTSTFGVYKVPQKGDVINEDYNIEPRNEYGKTKLMAENLVLSNNKNVVLRLANVYGKNMPSGKHSVVANFIDSIVKNKTLKVFEKDSTRDFLHVDDAVNSFIKALQFHDGGIFNICTGVETSVIELVRIIEDKLGKKAILNFSVSVSGSGYWRGDYSKAREVLNWQPQVDLKDGLTKILDEII